MYLKGVCIKIIKVKFHQIRFLAGKNRGLEGEYCNIDFWSYSLSGIQDSRLGNQTHALIGQLNIHALFSRRSHDMNMPSDWAVRLGRQNPCDAVKPAPHKSCTSSVHGSDFHHFPIDSSHISIFFIGIISRERLKCMSGRTTMQQLSMHVSKHVLSLKRQVMHSFLYILDMFIFSVNIYPLV